MLGKHEEVAGAHCFCEFRLGECAGEGYIFGGQGGEEWADLVLDGSDDGEVLFGVLEAGEGLEEIRDSFAEADLACEEELERVGGWRLGWGEVVEADSVGDDVDLFGRDAHFEKGSLCDG